MSQDDLLERRQARARLATRLAAVAGVDTRTAKRFLSGQTLKDKTRQQCEAAIAVLNKHNGEITVAADNAMYFEVCTRAITKMLENLRAL